MKKAIPEFKSEAEEFEFWSSTGEGADSTKFLDWSQAKRARFPNLKPSLRTISVRLPVAMIEDLKILANKRDVPYQSLLKVFLAERLETERRSGMITITSPSKGHSLTERHSEADSAIHRLKIERASGNGSFIEQRPEGNYAIRRPRAEHTSRIVQTQAEAIDRAREINANASILVERVRDTNVGGRDKWRNA
ncbi:MAG: BrnA antitoxin family protein [Terracidiphilus sp.]